MNSRWLALIPTFFLLTNCSLFSPTEEEEPTEEVRRPIILSDTVYRIRVPMQMPRRVVTFDCQLPPAPAGKRWELQLITPQSAQNDTYITLRHSDPSIPEAILHQPRFNDLAAFDEEADESAQLTAKMPLPRGRENGMLTLILSADLPVTFNQRVSVAALLKDA